MDPSQPCHECMKHQRCVARLYKPHLCDVPIHSTGMQQDTDIKVTSVLGNGGHVDSRICHACPAPSTMTKADQCEACSALFLHDCTPLPPELCNSGSPFALKVPFKAGAIPVLHRVTGCSHGHSAVWADRESSAHARLAQISKTYSETERIQRRHRSVACALQHDRPRNTVSAPPHRAVVPIRKGTTKHHRLCNHEVKVWLKWCGTPHIFYPLTERELRLCPAALEASCATGGIPELPVGRFVATATPASCRGALSNRAAGPADVLFRSFNYRSTHHLTTNGFYEFLNWFDERAWYPLGRIVGGTVYPGLMVTAGLIHYVLNLLHVTVHIRDVCVFLAPIFSGLTSISTFLLTRELWNQGAGLLAACFIAIVPGYISRSVAGSFDNEGIAIFALQFTYYLWELPRTANQRRPPS
ncbi:hypothetical protein JZ751_009667 [Albula glossodonta]|uniref:dolichyl-diphosphooligosaccharide--protein glycotransferase n=1 Tax=Albula glossodonta TaxID=121402 RepID=A0A8T2NYC0_9TELE|nr:hypothetical protein JZ751_009667 [Albula glossodonta]